MINCRFSSDRFPLIYIFFGLSVFCFSISYFGLSQRRHEVSCRNVEVVCIRVRSSFVECVVFVLWRLQRIVNPRTNNEEMERTFLAFSRFTSDGFTEAKSRGLREKEQVLVALPDTPCLAFRNLPQDFARTGYATERALFISECLSTDTVNGLRKVWVLKRPWKQHNAEARA